MLPLKFLDQYVSEGLQEAYARIQRQRIEKIINKINTEKEEK